MRKKKSEKFCKDVRKGEPNLFGYRKYISQLGPEYSKKEMMTGRFILAHGQGDFAGRVKQQALVQLDVRAMKKKTQHLYTCRTDGFRAGVYFYLRQSNTKYIHYSSFFGSTVIFLFASFGRGALLSGPSTCGGHVPLLRGRGEGNEPGDIDIQISNCNSTNYHCHL